MKVLLAEDDLMIGEEIRIALGGEGFSVDWVKSGKAVDIAVRSQVYDALLLDLGLPHKDGIEVLRELRAGGSQMPVLVMTARDTVTERILGLNTGADDYLIKPFDLDEMIARLHALIRRAQGRKDPVYRKGAIEINLRTRQALVADGQTILSSREWAVLEALIARPGAVLSREQLEHRLYGLSGDFESNAIEVYIHGLRKKLGADFITNIRGVGYMVEKT